MMSSILFRHDLEFTTMSSRVHSVFSINGDDKIQIQKQTISAWHELQ